jgi:protein-S-isoprenylcysteine O-methyltransferase Ste14
MTKSTEQGAAVRVPPPLVFAVAIVLGWLVPGLRLHQHHAARIGAGAVLIALGLALGGAAIGLFRKTGQDPKPWEPTPSLIFDGPYRFTRNPMYVGMTLFTLAAAALAGHFWIAVLVPVALAAVHFTAVLPEERYLTGKFGDGYTKYTTKVRRYI